MKLFLCHDSADTVLVGNIYRHLGTLGLKCYYYPESQPTDQSWRDRMILEAMQTDAMIVFIGDDFRDHQRVEFDTAWGVYLEQVRNSGRNPAETRKKWVFVHLKRGDEIPAPVCAATAIGGELGRIFHQETTEPREIARQIAGKLGVVWAELGLPSNPHLFSYETQILDHVRTVKAAGAQFLTMPYDMRDSQNARTWRNYLDGAPREWPAVREGRDLGWWPENQCYPNGLVQPPLANSGAGNDAVPLTTPPKLNIGKPRPLDSRVAVAALFKQSEEHPSGVFSLPEAGPREFLRFPRGQEDLRVGIIVSGGIAPGINAVVDGIVQRHWLYAKEGGKDHRKKLVVYGFLNGFSSLTAENLTEPQLLAAGSEQKNIYVNGKTPGAALTLITAGYAHEGGSIIGTSRVGKLLEPEAAIVLEQMVASLLHKRIDILYVIGGDGSMKAAHAIFCLAQANFKKALAEHPTRPPPRHLSVVGVPKTMDNDILWVWQSFGFMSAVEKARDVIETLHMEISSNPRFGVVQLFGSVSGFVVSHAVLASSTGHCELALIPEASVPFSVQGVARYMQGRMATNAEDRNHHAPFGLIVMAETAIPLDVENYLGLELKPETGEDVYEVYRVGLTTEEEKALRKFLDDNRTVVGQTSDALRTAGLKLMSVGLTKLLKQLGRDDRSMQWQELRCLTNEPRHILRAAAPSCADIINCQRLGTLVVDNAMAGYTDFMISQWLTEFVLVPLCLVVLGRKQIYTPGIFWKSVIAKTQQYQADIHEWTPRPARE